MWVRGGGGERGSVRCLGPRGGFGVQWGIAWSHAVLVHRGAACPQKPPRVRQCEAPPPLVSRPPPASPRPFGGTPPGGRAVRGSPVRCETRVGNARFFIVTDAAARRWLKLRTQTWGWRGGGLWGGQVWGGGISHPGIPCVGGGCAPPRTAPRRGGSAVLWLRGKGLCPISSPPPPAWAAAVASGGGHASRGGGGSHASRSTCGRQRCAGGHPRSRDPRVLGCCHRWGSHGTRTPREGGAPRHSIPTAVLTSLVLCTAGGGVHTVPPPPTTPRWGCRRTPS